MLSFVALGRVRLATRRFVHVQTLFSLRFCPLALRNLASFAENVETIAQTNKDGCQQIRPANRLLSVR
jgi:hypothetical protein